MDKFIFICPHKHCHSFHVCEEDRDAICEVHSVSLVPISDQGPLLQRIDSLGEMCDLQTIQLKGMVEVVKQKEKETDDALFKLNNILDSPAGDFLKLVQDRKAMSLVEAFMGLINEGHEGHDETFAALYERLTQ